MSNPLPYVNLDAERRVIGSALLDPETIASLTIQSDDFASEAHRHIWDAITDLGKFADWATVKAWIERHRVLGEVEPLTGDVGIYLMTDAMQSIPTALNIARYAEDVIDLARRRALNAALEKALNDNAKGRPLTEIGGKVTASLAAIEPASKAQTLSEAIAEYSAEREAERDGTKTSGIPSGIGDLDRLTNGWRPGNLIVVAGASGGGKTTLMLSFALEAAKRHHKVMFIGMEMANKEIIRKAVAHISGVATGHDALSSMNPQKWDAEQDAMSRLATFRFIPIDAPGITVGGVAELIHKENTKGQLDLVIVDYLGAMAPEGGGNRNESRANQIGNITRALKALAGQAKCAIILGSQLNREFLPGVEPELFHLKDSSSIEQDANMVLMIYDPRDKASPLSRTLFLRKNRNGPTGDVPLIARLDVSRMIGKERESR